MTDVSRNGPALWAALLDEVGMLGTVVAGGCIRDFFLGVEPKDIDIFVPVADRRTLELLGDKLNAGFFFGLSDMCPEEGREYEEDDPLLIGVLEGEAMGLPVNIIARTSHATGSFDLISGFDFGILQWHYSYLEGTASIFGTNAAITDLAKREATLMHNKHHAQSLERFARFAARNGDILALNDPFTVSMDDFDFS